MGRIKIVEIGFNQKTNSPVLPEDWTDREFTNGYELQQEMNNLENRIGKPPVTFAIIYSMIIQKNDNIIKNLKNINFQKIIYLNFIINKFETKISNTVSKKTDYQYIKYNDILIGFKLDDILEPKSKENCQTKKEVGLLVSRLQKSIRRGRYGSKILIETIDALNSSPNYNLPEHNFLRVSSSKQLVWRLYISIIEDCRPYQSIYEPSLFDLILLTLITQKVQEYKFKKPVLKCIKLIALLAQYNDTNDDLYNWKALPISNKILYKNNSDFHCSLYLALTNLIMMPGDNKMLKKYYSENELFEPFMVPDELARDEWEKTLESNNYICHNDDTYYDILLSSFDMHTNPYIILYYQACTPIAMTTKQISNHIWNISSSYNIRSKKNKPEIDNTLVNIQKFFLKKSQLSNKKKIKNIDDKISENFTYKNNMIDKLIKRTSFLILFGKKYKYNGKEIILAGNKKNPICIKTNNEWVYMNDETILNAYPKQTIILSETDPPFGYKWIKSKVITQIIDGIPMINNKNIPFFDGSSIIKSIIPIISERISKPIYKVIIQLLTGLEIDFSSLLNFRKKYANKIFNWTPKDIDKKCLNYDLIKLAYTKIFNQLKNIIMIGPVTRGGTKMQNSINYLLEGKLWAIFNLFSYLYPDTIQPYGSLNFYIKKETEGYIHLINTLEEILFNKVKIYGSVPKIKTKLWDHQIESSDKILNGFKNGYHGFGDASDVGSGKTLTSLNIATQLIKINNMTFSGILVLLPGNKLIKTWDDELNKHTIGFDIKFQKNNSDIGSINKNTIVITTMGRMRDHPINHTWLLVIIDECLTVQNKNALWTESAWKQSMMAKYLLMMSATFFRTRFDKLYYMLKMLRTGLTEKKEYLETILLESIVSKISNNKRKWKSNFNYFILEDALQKKYEKISNSDLNIETKFAKLTSFLVSDHGVIKNVVSQLGELIKNLEKDNHKCLIYARAKQEAEFWSKKLNIPIYPVKDIHCIVTYHDGTYGLNDLVDYDTLVMRPPEPDKLPQIKGRLDRPGQKENNLYIEYFVLNDTIEMGLILRMKIASHFLKKYIMPLAKFYDVSVNYQKYIEE